MKILQVISSLQYGGAEKLVVDLSILLRKKGYQVDVAVFQKSNTPLKNNLIAAGCQVYEFSNHPYSLLCLYKLYKLMSKYDLVHTHNYSPQLYGAICSLFSHTPIITTEHSPSNRRRSYKIFSYLDRFMYKQYQHIIGISQQAIDNLQSFIGPLSQKIALIPNGIDVQLYHNTEPNLKLKKDPNRFVIINVAGFRIEKDQPTLIKAMSLLPKDKYELWLVGDGIRRPELEHLIQQYHLENNVILWGIRSDVPTLLKTADIVAMCSHYEGLSLSSIEGMSVEKPFIADDVTGLREITLNAGLLFPYKDYKTCAKIITQLEEDKNLYKTTAKKCYQKALHYDIHKTVNAYKNIYQEVLS